MKSPKLPKGTIIGAINSSTGLSTLIYDTGFRETIQGTFVPTEQANEEK
jgi:hypothetical protein